MIEQARLRAAAANRIPACTEVTKRTGLTFSAPPRLRWHRQGTHQPGTAGPGPAAPFRAPRREPGPASLPCPGPCPDQDAQAGAVNERQVRQVRDDMRVTGHGLREHRPEVRGVSDI